MSPSLRVGDRATRAEAANVAGRHEIEERERLMRNRVFAAIRGGHFWTIVRAELARDYSSLFDNIWRLEQQIDLRFAANCRDAPASAGTLGRRRLRMRRPSVR